jgi:hypothetical protein
VQYLPQIMGESIMKFMIEASQGFIKEQDFWRGRKGASQSDTLGFAPRKSQNRLFRCLIQADKFE